jgi:hypothetical protein
MIDALRAAGNVVLRRPGPGKPPAFPRRSSTLAWPVATPSSFCCPGGARLRARGDSAPILPLSASEKLSFFRIRRARMPQDGRRFTSRSSARLDVVEIAVAESLVEIAVAVDRPLGLVGEGESLPQRRTHRRPLDFRKHVADLLLRGRVDPSVGNGLFPLEIRDGKSDPIVRTCASCSLVVWPWQI